MPVTRDDIEKGLKRIGLESGDIVVVHSSLSSFGRVKGGADTVIDAILSVIGPEGTMVVPTFNYNPDVFDPNVTPSIVGQITETVRKRPEAMRSLHPTHSAAAIGEKAKEITEGHESADPFGVGSPLHKVLEMNGKILQIGTTHKSNSIIHVAEELTGVPYLERGRAVTVAMPNKQTRQMIIRRPGCSRGFDKIEDYLEETGTVRETMIGDSRVRLMPAADVVASAIRLLSEDPGALLCDIGDCESCAEANAMIQATRAAEEDERLSREWEEQEHYTLRDTGEECNLLRLDEITEEGCKNGEYDPD